MTTPRHPRSAPTRRSFRAPSIALVKREVRAVDLAAARALAGEALSCSTSTEVRELLRGARSG